MIKAVAMGMVLALVAVVFTALPLKVGAAQIRSITPSKGMAGKPVIIHGSGLEGHTVEAKFGSRSAEGVEVLNDRAIKATVPTRGPLDILFNVDPVPVKVTVDGIPAGEVPFSYKILGSEPVITGFDPSEAKVETIFTLTVYGTDFTTPQGRYPDRAFLIGPQTIEGTILDDSIFIVDVEFEVTGVLLGLYTIVISYSDGAVATAEGFQVTE